MAIPVSYNLRNLVVRKTTTIMTALGITLTVAVLLSVLALVNGLQTAFQSSGNPLQILVMRKGSNAELSSAVTREVYQDLKSMPGIARQDNQPIASLEMVTVINLPSVDSPEGMNVTLRGILPLGIQMRDGLKLQAGRWFRAGQREVVVGKSIASRYPGAHLGNKLRFGRGDWEVVGVMDGGQSSVNSEIFGDLNQTSSDFNRSDGLSSVLVRATDAATVPALINSLNDDRRLGVVAQTEKDYYDSQTSSGARIAVPGNFHLHHHGGRQQLRRHEHHVRRGRPARQRNRHSARAGLFARQHPDQLLARIGVAFRPRRLARLRPGPPAQ